MGQNNRDRYGKRHRKDKAYDVGEGTPGEVGDSEGTIHDRATKDNRVTVDGETVTYEEYERRQQQSDEEDSHDHEHSWETSDTESTQDSAVTESGQFDELDGATVEVEVDRISGGGNPIAEYNGYHVHVHGGTPGQRYMIELSANSGYFTGVIKQNE